MNDHLKQLYFQKASDLALKNNISGALVYLKKLDISQMDDSFKKFTGLCLYRLGKFEDALKYAGSYPEYSELHSAYSLYSVYINDVESYLKKSDIKAAYAVIKRSSLHSVNEYNMLGCICMLLKKRNEAEEYFHMALQLDCYNKTTIRLLTNIITKPDEKDRGWFFKIFSKR